ncbi:hypothetical protein BGW42_007508 [Actinomortierella wolfii]|nr:hypothetical protein BGW42_007508 [Actinomortierella wolfii]
MSVTSPVNLQSLELGKRIGDGTFGNVYKGTYGRRVAAVKIFKLASCAMSLDAIKKEVELLQTLQSRYIIQFYGVEYREDEVWLITDYAEHGSLKRAIDKNLLTEWKDKIRIAQEIADGLAHIHQMNVLHRDLKSANVLLTSFNEVRICDFGAATTLGVNESSTSVARHGTLQWMAPELLDGKLQYSAKSDVYALGMVMWEMAAMSTVPFQHMSHSEIEAAVLSGKREQLPDGTGDSTSEDTPNHTTGYIPDNFRYWIERCWKHDPSERPEAHEVALENFAQATSWRASVISYLSDSITLASSRYSNSKLCLAHENNSRTSLQIHPLTTDESVDQQHRDLNYLLRMAECNVVDAQINLASMYEKGNDVVTKDDKMAFSWYLRAAKNGHLEAMRQVGEMYSKGRGTEQDEEEAARWNRLADEREVPVLRDDIKTPHNDKALKKGDSNTFSWLRSTLQKGYLAAKSNYQIRQAAEGGDPKAQFNLGEMYRVGKGVEQSDTEAVEWYTMAANQGYPYAQFSLGMMYGLGRGVKQSDNEAVDWYTKAANQGYPYAQFTLGMLHEHGRGVKQSDTEAVRWYTKAAKQGDPEAQFNLGVKYDKGQGVEQSYTEAIKWYTMAAKQGNSEAQFSLGRMYENGQSLSKSDTEAVKWYTMAAIQGYSYAQYNLGMMYRHGKGVEHNNTEAIKWYTRAARQGHPIAQYNLGMMHEHGCGVKQSYTEAFKWYTMAAEQGYPNAQLSLGEMYRVGQGVNQNNDEAAKWYTMAATNGNLEAQFNLGQMYRVGHCVKHSNTEAIKWYTMAANQGYPDAQFHLGVMHGLGQGVKKSDTVAVRWYTMAAILGNPKAQFNLGVMYMNGEGVRQSYTEAARWYTMSARQGDPKAQFILGMMHETGHGVSQSNTEAVKWYTKAANQGYRDAQFSLGEMYRAGQGVEQSYTEAVKWYTMAANQGYTRAQFNLGEMYKVGEGVK